MMIWGIGRNNIDVAARAARLCAAACLIVASVSGAAAQENPDQDVSPNFSVSERFAANFRAPGVQAGGFTLYPSAQAEGVYDDNILRVETAPESDFIANLTGALRAESNWSRHQFVLESRLNRRQYAERGDESTTDYAVGGAARLDLGSRSFLRPRAAYARSTEPRSAAQTAVGAVNPVRYDSLSAGADLLLRQTRFRQEFGVDYRKDDFSDVFTQAGAEIDQDFRDRETYAAYGRLFARVRPTVELFVEGRGQKVVYDSSQVAIGAIQDSRGYSVAGGVAFDINKVARGEIGVGYTSRNFEDPLFVDIKGLNIDAELEYFVTDLTTVTIAADRSIQDASVIGAAGYWTNGVSATVEHELLRSVLLVATGEYRRDEFRELDRQDSFYRVSAGVDYAFRREVLVSLRYSHSNLSSDGLLARDGFAGNVVRLGLTFRL